MQTFVSPIYFVKCGQRCRCTVPCWKIVKVSFLVKGSLIAICWRFEEDIKCLPSVKVEAPIPVPNC